MEPGRGKMTNMTGVESGRRVTTDRNRKNGKCYNRARKKGNERPEPGEGEVLECYENQDKEKKMKELDGYHEERKISNGTRKVRNNGVELERGEILKLNQQ